ncbi:hypothetical protein AB5I41_31005 [Sphingomonas sp. MMS24-JH45]
MEVLRIPRLIDLYQKTDAYKRLSEGSQKLYGIFTWLQLLRTLLPSAPAAEVTRVHMQRLVDNMGSRRSCGQFLSGRRVRHVQVGKEARPCAGEPMR